MKIYTLLRGYNFKNVGSHNYDIIGTYDSLEKAKTALRKNYEEEIKVDGNETLIEKESYCNDFKALITITIEIDDYNSLGCDEQCNQYDVCSIQYHIEETELQ